MPDGEPLPGEEPPHWIRRYTSTLIASTSIFGALGISTGGVLYFAALLGEWKSPWSYFFVGTCVTPGLFSFIYSTDYFFERRLRKLKTWYKDGLISKKLYEQHRKHALEWRTDRLYGGVAKTAPSEKQ